MEKPPRTHTQTFRSTIGQKRGDDASAVDTVSASGNQNAIRVCLLDANLRPSVDPLPDRETNQHT